MTLDRGLLERLDGFVKRRVFANRSKAVQAALAEKFARLARSRLARECAKLDRDFEKSMAEEGISPDPGERPEY